MDQKDQISDDVASDHRNGLSASLLFFCSFNRALSMQVGLHFQVHNAA